MRMSSWIVTFAVAGALTACLSAADDGSNWAIEPREGLASDSLAGTITYLKASNTSGGAAFGYSIALSTDGSTLAVGARAENGGAGSSGAVYVFVRSGASWAQQAYIKASNIGLGDGFGSSVALSSDGSTLAVGSPGEASSATGIGGNQANNAASFSGAVYLFSRSGTTWSQQAYVKASNTNANDHFGSSLALSVDGSTLIVGAEGESSSATGVGGNQADDSVGLSGAVYVFH